LAFDAPASRAMFERPETGNKWRAQGNDLRTFLGDFVAALPQIEFLD
jgi:hypothetical protein